MKSNSQNNFYIKEYVSRINNVFDYIENNITEDLNVETLAGVANFSRFHFHRIFSSLVGESLQKYIRRVRLEKAANLLLLNKELPVTDIAYECGFASLSAFSKAFKNQFNMSASKWRESRDAIQSKNGQINSKNGKLIREVSPYFCTIFNNNNNMDMENTTLKRIEVRELEEMTVAYIRHIGPYKGDSSLFEGLIGRIMAWAGSKGLINFPKTKMINVYHDNPKITDEDKLRLSVCLTVPKDTKTEGDIGKMVLSGGRYVIGSFELKSNEFEQAWTYTYNWLMKNGYQPADSLSFENCKNNPAEHPEHKHIVDICVPVCQ